MKQFITVSFIEHEKSSVSKKLLIPVDDIQAAVESKGVHCKSTICRVSGGESLVVETVEEIEELIWKVQYIELKEKDTGFKLIISKESINAIFDNAKGSTLNVSGLDCSIHVEESAEEIKEMMK